MRSRMLALVATLMMVLAVGCSGKNSTPPPANAPGDAAPASTAAQDSTESAAASTDAAGSTESNAAASTEAAGSSETADVVDFSPLIETPPEGASEKMIEHCRPGDRLSDMMTIGIEDYKGTLYCRAELVKEGGKWVYYYDEDMNPVWMILEAKGQRIEYPMKK